MQVYFHLSQPHPAGRHLPPPTDSSLTSTRDETRPRALCPADSHSTFVSRFSTFAVLFSRVPFLLAPPPRHALPPSKGTRTHSAQQCLLLTQLQQASEPRSTARRSNCEKSREGARFSRPVYLHNLAIVIILIGISLTFAVSLLLLINIIINKTYANLKFPQSD